MRSGKNPNRIARVARRQQTLIDPSKLQKSNTVASASTIDLSYPGDPIYITGSTTINGIADLPRPAYQFGAHKRLIFNSTPTLTHSAALVLPTGVNLTMVAGDECTATWTSEGVWTLTQFMHKNGTPFAVVPIAQGGTGETIAGAAIDAIRGTMVTLNPSTSGVLDLTDYETDVIYIIPGANISITGFGFMDAETAEKTIIFDTGGLYTITLVHRNLGSIGGTADIWMYPPVNTIVSQPSPTNYSICKFRYFNSAGVGSWHLSSIENSISGHLPLAGIEEARLLFADNATGNASTTKHGFLKKLSNTSTEFMNGQGNWAVPPAPTDIAGNAATATVLQTTRTINGMSFNGGANITAHYISFTSTSEVPSTSTTWTGIHNIITFAAGSSSGISRSNSTLTFTRTGVYAIWLTMATFNTNDFLGLRLRRTNNTATTLVKGSGYATGTSQTSPATIHGIFTVGATDDAIDVQYARKGDGSSSTFAANTIDSEAMATFNCFILQIG